MNENCLDGEHCILRGSPEEYEHPLDRQALDVLEGTPGLELAIRKMNEYGIERLLRAQYAGSYFQVTEQSLLRVHAIIEQVCRTLNVPQVPEVYIKQGYAVDAYVIGSEQPMIVLNTGAVSKLTDKELTFVLGHEVGHIKSQHMVYHMLGQEVLPILGGWIAHVTLGLGGVISAPIQWALFGWYRRSELTCDRAGLLAAQDLDAAVTAMMKLAGVPESEYDRLNPQCFLQQARGYQDFDQHGLDKVAKRVSVITRTHPWTVMRGAELDSWVKSGAYDDLLRDHRDQEVHKAFCRRCGKPAKPTATYCVHCGSEI